MLVTFSNFLPGAVTFLEVRRSQPNAFLAGKHGQRLRVDGACALVRIVSRTLKGQV